MERKTKIEVIPYLSFKGNCEEAVNSYIKAFGGDIMWMSRWSEENFESPEQIGKIVIYAAIQVWCMIQIPAVRNTGSAVGSQPPV